MRHRKHRNQLGVKKEHRLALLANLSTALITHGRIKTTLKKAKALRPFVERVITLAKKGSLHDRRIAISRVRDTDAVHVLFDEKAQQFAERPGGYTRIYKIGTRRGDAAEMAMIELIDADDEGYPKRKGSGKGGSRKTAKKKAAPAADEKQEAAEEPSEPESEPEAQATAETDDAQTAEEDKTGDEEKKSE